jgi:predicted pyridoxine 5'-phosphate oxidase superfamily flavin-nucleotide-binding protein
VKNIEKGSKVAVGAAKRADGGYDGYMIKGSAKIVEEGPLYETIRRIVEEATKGKRSPRSAILITVEEVYSLKPSPDRKRIL